MLIEVLVLQKNVVFPFFSENFLKKKFLNIVSKIITLRPVFLFSQDKDKFVYSLGRRHVCEIVSF
jgi:hypothetical protein